MTPLRQSILKTLAFFAAQGQAVTLLELSSVLFRASAEQKEITLQELVSALEELSQDKVVSQMSLYVLRDYRHLFTIRHDRYINSLKLFKKTRRFATALHHMPFVRAVALSGSVVSGNASPDSDIDLFILVQPGRMYLARAFVSAYFQIFGGRRHGRSIQKRFCLNHYVAGTESLSEDHNFYTAVEYTNLIPVFGKEKIKQFFKNNQFWIKEFLLQPQFSESAYFTQSNSEGSGFQKFLETLLGPFANLLERLSKVLQRRRIRASDTVLVLDNELSFHPESKGQQILAKFRDIASQVSL